MFAIVLWEIDSTFTVVGLKTVVSPRKDIECYIVGENVTAPFRGKPLACRIYQIGDNRAELTKQLNNGFQLDLEVIDNRRQKTPAKAIREKTLKKSSKAVTEKTPVNVKATSTTKRKVSTESQPSKKKKSNGSFSDEFPEDEYVKAMEILKMRRESSPENSIQTVHTPSSHTLVAKSLHVPSPQTLVAKSLHVPSPQTSVAKSLHVPSPHSVAKSLHVPSPHSVAKSLHVPSPHTSVAKSLHVPSQQTFSRTSLQPSPAQTYSDAVLQPRAQPAPQTQKVDTGFSFLDDLSTAMDTVYGHKSIHSDECSCLRMIEGLQVEFLLLQEKVETLARVQNRPVSPISTNQSTPLSSQSTIHRSETVRNTPTPPTLVSVSPQPSSSISQDHSQEVSPKDDNLMNTLKAEVQYERCLAKAVGLAMRKVFTVNELTTSTLKGHHTNKTMGSPRPGLDSTKRTTIVEVMVSKFGCTQEDVLKKMRTCLRSMEARYRGLDGSY